jgi:high-affinity iron transporter
MRLCSALAAALAAAVVLSAAAVLAAAPASAAAAATPAGVPPWQAAERLRADLFAAQSALITAGPADAARRVARARTRYAGELRAGVLAAGADADAAAREALADAARAARAGDQPALAAARGAARAALLRGAYAGALAAAGRTDAAEARSWLLLRDFRTATRFTRRAPTPRRPLRRSRPGGSRRAPPARRSRRTSWTPTRHGCGSCSTTRAAASTAACQSVLRRPPARPRATSRSCACATPRTAGVPPP